MVQKDHFNGYETFQCSGCGLHYAKRARAEVCEKYCETYGESHEINRQALEHQETA